MIKRPGVKYRDRVCRLDGCDKVFTPQSPNQQYCCRVHQVTFESGQVLFGKRPFTMADLQGVSPERMAGRIREVLKGTREYLSVSR